MWRCGWVICDVFKDRITLRFTNKFSSQRQHLFAQQRNIISHTTGIFLYSKVKVLPVQATKALRADRGIALPNLRPWHWRWGGGVSTTLRPLYPRERPGTHCTGGCLGPRASLDGCGKSRPHRDSIPGPSSPERVAIPTGLSRPPFFTVFCLNSTDLLRERRIVFKFARGERMLISSCLSLIYCKQYNFI